jgi:lysophospholipase L1-like esterase
MSENAIVTVPSPVRAACLGLSILLWALAAAGCRSGDREDRPLLRYVSLGDSFPAGDGLAGATGPCRRSPGAYPNLVAQRASLLPLLRACSGATTGDLLDRGRNPDEGRQLDWLATDTDVVTLTVGGNDVGFGRVVGACLTGGTPCSRLDGDVDRSISSLEERLEAVNGEIRRRSPSARFLVVGYPHLVADPRDVDLAACREAGMSASPAARITADEAQWLREKGEALNDVMRRSAEVVGARYVEVTSAFAGHEVCAPAPWMTGVVEADIGASFHPNPAGHEALARLVTAVLVGR